MHQLGYAWLVWLNSLKKIVFIAHFDYGHFWKKKWMQPNVVLLQQLCITDAVNMDDSNLMIIPTCITNSSVNPDEKRKPRMHHRIRKMVNPVMEIGYKSFLRAYKMTTIHFYAALFTLLKSFLPKAQRSCTYVWQHP